MHKTAVLTILLCLMGMAGLWSRPVLAVEEAIVPVAEADVVAVPNLNGEWSGTWASCERGHQGPLRATFCQIDGCHYQVKFKGRFCKVIPFHYTSVLTVTGTADGRIWLQGSERLGLLLGTFSMNGWATSSQFVSSYSSKDDRGQFTLQRCR